MTALARDDRFPTNGRAPAVLEYRDSGRAGDRLPPQNLDAERSVLGGIMLAGSMGDPSLIDDVRSILRPDDFYRDSHQIVYRTMLSLHACGTGVDAVTVADDLQTAGLLDRIGGDDALLEIANSVPHSANARHHAEIVKQKSVMRQAIQLAAETIERAYGAIYTSGDVVNLLNSGAQRLAAESRIRDDDDLAVWYAPKAPSAKAYYGLLGSICKAIDPHTEACLPAVLLQMLTAFGNVVDHGPYWMHDRNKHHLNIYSCIVGPTGVGRKGTGWSVTEENVCSIDEDWRHDRVETGIQSGEYLVELLADESVSREGRLISGVTDKRLLMFEPEFDRVMGLYMRDGNSLGSYTKIFWERGWSSAGSRKNSISCTDAHVSMIAHVTPYALNTQFSLAEVTGGLGNRMIWCWSMQSKDLSRSNAEFDPSSVRPMVAQLQRAADHVRSWCRSNDGLMRLDPSARKLWGEVGDGFKRPRGGNLGDLLVRARPNVMRMAAIFAATDASFEINVPHLEAALALWEYCEASVDYIFRDRLGDRDGEKLIEALRDAGEDGLSQTQVFKQVFAGNMKAEKLNKLLGAMSRDGKIHRSVKKGDSSGGRPVTNWRLGPDLAPPLPTPPPTDLRI